MVTNKALTGLNQSIIEEAYAVKDLYEAPDEFGTQSATVLEVAKMLKVSPERVRILLELVSTPTRPGMRRSPINTLDDIRDRCDLPDGEDGCWFWKGATDTNGYGTVSWRGRSMRVHHLVMELMGIVRHHRQQTSRFCDVAHCCAPHHIAYEKEDVRVCNDARTDAVSRPRSKGARTAARIGVLANGRKLGPAPAPKTPLVEAPIEETPTPKRPPLPPPELSIDLDPNLEPVTSELPLPADAPVIEPIIRNAPAHDDARTQADLIEMLSIG